MYKFKSVILAAMLAAPLASAANAKSLRDEPTIDGPMLSVAIAIEARLYELLRVARGRPLPPQLAA